MSRWKSVGGVWSKTWTTLREIDVNAIREESEQAFTVACFGQRSLLDSVAQLLQADTVDPYDETPEQIEPRYGSPDARAALSFYTLPYTTPAAPHADMLLLVLDGRQPLSPTAASTLDELSATSLPLLIVVLYGEQMPALDSGDRPPLLPTMRLVTLAEPQAEGASERLAQDLLDTLPSELYLAAARRIPALRAAVASKLIQTTAFSNAAYALGSGISEEFPVLNISVAAADMLVLTKNQVMLIYKLALAHGAPPDFQGVMREALSVVGMAYIWRQVARTLVGLVPVVGLVPKVAVAYAGTYTVGVAAWRWFATGELVSRQEMQAISQDSLRRGREVFARLQAQMRSGSTRFTKRLGRPGEPTRSELE